MGMMHLRVICSDDDADRVADEIGHHLGAVAVHISRDTSHGAVVSADLARESVDDVLDAMHRLGVPDTGMVTLEPLDTVLGKLADQAEDEAPGDGADALIWEELAGRTGEDSELTGTYLAFMTLATILAAIGVVTDSQVTVVGAMVIGPDFGPLAGMAVGLIRRRHDVVRRAATALLVGFPVAIVITALLALVGRAVGLIEASDLTGNRATDFIYHPGWFSLITALVAGTAGMLSLTSSKSSALVGVFISITTIPAAGNVAVASVLGNWHETWLSLAQLAINLVGIVAAALLTLVVIRRTATATGHGAARRAGPPRPGRARAPVPARTRGRA